MKDLVCSAATHSARQTDEQVVMIIWSAAYKREVPDNLHLHFHFPDPVIDPTTVTD